MVGLTVAGGGCAASAFGVWQYQRDEGFRRSVALYSQVGPVVARYRFVEAKHKLLQTEKAEAAAEWLALDRHYAPLTTKLLEELQGMYTKYGQMAAGLTNTFSKTWIEQLRRLEDSVPPRARAVVERTVLEETGERLEDVFSEWDDAPLGSASIGQVHRATMAADGREVAVKIQYPDAARLFRRDMKSIRGFLTLAAPEQIVILDKLEEQFEEEFDYEQEARNLEEVGANMRAAGFEPAEVVVRTMLLLLLLLLLLVLLLLSLPLTSLLQVPRPHLEWCRPRMLVMELVPGIKLVDRLREYGEQHAAAQGLSYEELVEQETRKIEVRSLL